MQTVTTIGFDIAKSVFQMHGVDTAGQLVIPVPIPKKLDQGQEPEASDDEQGGGFIRVNRRPPPLQAIPTR